MKKCYVLLTIIVLGTLALQASSAQNGIWNDPSSGLSWIDGDNGKSLVWAEAAEYCQKLSLGGHSDWRLPNVNELRTISDTAKDQNECYVKPSIHLSGCFVWSSSPSSEEGFNLGYDLKLPQGAVFLLDKSNSAQKVLCVRGALVEQPTESPKKKKKG